MNIEKSDCRNLRFARPCAIAIYLLANLIAFLLIVFIVWYGPPIFGIYLSPEKLIMLKPLVYSFCFGGIGGTCYSIYGLYQHVAANDYNPAYCYWYWFRGPLGAILGMVCYLLTQGGILVFADVNLKDMENHCSSFRSKAAICGLAFLAGYCTNQFTGKMQDIARTLFGKDSHRK